MHSDEYTLNVSDLQGLFLFFHFLTVWSRGIILILISYDYAKSRKKYLVAHCYIHNVALWVQGNRLGHLAVAENLMAKGRTVYRKTWQGLDVFLRIVAESCNNFHCHRIDKGLSHCIHQCGTLHRGKDCCAKKPSGLWLLFWCIDHYRIIFTMPDSTTTTIITTKSLKIYFCYNVEIIWLHEILKNSLNTYSSSQGVTGFDLYTGLLDASRAGVPYPELQCYSWISFQSW